MTRVPAAVFVALALLAACGSERPTETRPSPTPSPTPSPGLPGATPGRASGPTAIVLVAADPPPGATIAGCGSDASGCAGRVRMSFRVTPTGSGPVLVSVGFLHAADKTACLQGRSGPSALQAGEPQTVEIVFDRPDEGGRCRTPLELTDLAFNVEGTIEVASRQEWAFRYRLVP